MCFIEKVTKLYNRMIGLEKLPNLLNFSADGIFGRVKKEFRTYVFSFPYFPSVITNEPNSTELC